MVIWGTGEYSYKIAQKMKDVNDQLHSLFQMDLFDLIVCLDSNKERTNDQHLGVKVVQPQYFFEQEYTENQLIIVAIKNHRSVFEWLAAHDYLRSNIITYDKFWYKGENLSCKIELYMLKTYKRALTKLMRFACVIYRLLAKKYYLTWVSKVPNDTHIITIE